MFKINQCGKKIQGLKGEGGIMPSWREGREFLDFYPRAGVGIAFYIVFQSRLNGKWTTCLKCCHQNNNFICSILNRTQKYKRELVWIIIKFSFCSKNSKKLSFTKRRPSIAKNADSYLIFCSLNGIFLLLLYRLTFVKLSLWLINRPNFISK